MNNRFPIILTILPVLLITILLPFCDLGDQPFGPKIGKDTVTVIEDIIGDSVIWESGTMEIFVDPSDLPASSEQTASVKVRLVNNLHNPIIGRDIFFAATHGIIPPSAVTNTDGIAEVTFTSEPIDTEASIIAWIWEIDSKGDSTKIVVKHTVTISGIDIQIIPTATHALLNTVVPVTITVTDAAGKAVANKPVFLSGSVIDTLTTMGNGNAVTSVTSGAIGAFVINAESQGAFATESIRFDTSITGIDTTTNVRRLRIFSSKSQLKADNTDHATITAILINDNNNPAVGDTVKFAIDNDKNQIGIIGEFGIIDASGRASVTLQSTPNNGVCIIYGETSDQLLKDTTTVLFSGVSLQLTTKPIDLKTGQYSTLQALLTDASGHPIENDKVRFFFPNNNPTAHFEGGSKDTTVALGTDGIAEAKVTSTSAQSLVVKANSASCVDSVTINFTTNILTLTASDAVISIGGSDYSTLRATYRDVNSNLISGAWINFYTNAGELSADAAITVNGVATTNLYSAQFAGVATVEASAPNGSAKTTVEFAAINAADIDLKISPDNIGVNGGVAVLEATVTDPQGNMVSNATVNFKILKGPGGDEYIDESAVVSKEGVARTNLHAGSQPSQYRGCEVAASVGTISDTSKMTISGEPFVVTVARPQDDTIVVTEAGQIGPSTFKFNIGGVVQDVNGNNVADDMEVHFSAVVSGMAVARKRFVRWNLTLTDIEPVIDFKLLDVPFEDINHNFMMDQNIDFDLDEISHIASRGDDKNGDGIMDYDYASHDFFWDFNLDGVCNVGLEEPCWSKEYEYAYDTIIINNDTTINTIKIDSFCTIYADLNDNGVWDKTELNRDLDTNNFCDLPPSGDFEFSRWEMRKYFQTLHIPFHNNDFAVVIEVSAVTKDGVAETTITYPRQFAHRLYVTVNAEIDGIRDRDGERFILPVLIEGK